MKFDLTFNENKIGTSFLAMNLEFMTSRPSTIEIKNAFEKMPESFPVNLGKKSVNLSFFLMALGCEGSQGIRFFVRKKNDQTKTFYSGVLAYSWQELVKQCLEKAEKPFILLYFL